MCSQDQVMNSSQYAPRSSKQLIYTGYRPKPTHGNCGILFHIFINSQLKKKRQHSHHQRYTDDDFFFQQNKKLHILNAMTQSKGWGKTTPFQTTFFVTDILNALVIRKRLSITLQKYFLGKLFPNRKKVPKLKIKKI